MPSFFEKSKLNYLIARQKRIKQLRLATYLVEPALETTIKTLARSDDAPAENQMSAWSKLINQSRYR